MPGLHVHIRLGLKCSLKTNTLAYNCRCFQDQTNRFITLTPEADDINYLLAIVKAKQADMFICSVQTFTNVSFYDAT
jgi:hypothetical protein